MFQNPNQKMLPLRIPNVRLVNSTITYGTTTVSLGGSSPSISGLTGLDLTSTGQLDWNSDTWLTRSAAATLQLGQADAAAPVAQTIQTQSVATGTSNTAGANLTINGSKSTGSASGGFIYVQVTPAGGAGSSQNTLTPIITIAPSAGVIVAQASAQVLRTTQNGAVTPKFQVMRGSTGNNNSAVIGSYPGANATSPATLFLAMSRNATLGNQTAVVSGDQLGAVNNEGSDGTNFQDSSQVRGEVDAAVSAGIVPGRVLVLTANSAGTLTEAMRWDSAQKTTFSGSAKLASFTVAGLPSASTAGSGSFNFITDAKNIPNLGRTATGGGLNSGLVYSDGTSWLGITGATFRNILLNGSFDVWQRGAGDSSSFAVAASTTAYTADRWYITTGANEAFTVAAQAALHNRSRKACRVQRNSGQTGTAAVTLGYPLTTDECIQLRGETLALQFLASTGANWSPTSGTLTYNVYFGTGTQGKRGAGFTGETNPISGTVNLAVSSGTITTTRNSTTTTVATNVTQGEVQFTFSPTGTAGANDFVDLDDVQLEFGIVNTQYERLPFNHVLMEMKRHYQKTFPYATAPAQNGGVAGALVDIVDFALATGIDCYYWRFASPMIAAPTITTYNPSAANANWRDVANSADFTATVDPDAAKSADGFAIEVTDATTATNRRLYIHAQADSGL